MTSADAPPDAASDAPEATALAEGPQAAEAGEGPEPAEAAATPDATAGEGPSTHTQALAWVESAPHADTPAPDSLDGIEQSEPEPAPLVWLLPARVRRRGIWAVLVPLVLLVAIVAAYAVAMAVWPLTALVPTVGSAQMHPQPAPAATPAWPAQGSASVGVAGFGAPVASTTAPSSIASITKLVTTLVVLDRSPVTAQNQGPSFAFSESDQSSYWQYLGGDQSALDVPVDGTLTQYQMLEGMLIGSANNYAARLASTWWPSTAAFASAANTWLDAHGIDGITITDPTGIDPGNTATPAALIALGQRAMADPVIAGIVSQKSVDLPGAGVVENTNALLADPGVVGLKTGTLDAYNVLAAKDVTVGHTTARIYAAILDQPDPATRWAVARDLLAQTEKQLALRPSVAAGTIVGTVRTAWGDRIRMVTTTDADVVLWNGATAEISTSFALGESRTKGRHAGTLTARGALDAVTVPVVLASDIPGPSFWWRVTHPMELLGIR